jgi:hypothetical protein
MSEIRSFPSCYYQPQNLPAAKQMLRVPLRRPSAGNLRVPAADLTLTVTSSFRKYDSEARKVIPQVEPVVVQKNGKRNGHETDDNTSDSCQRSVQEVLKCYNTTIQTVELKKNWI